MQLHRLSIVTFGTHRLATIHNVTDGQRHTKVYKLRYDTIQYDRRV